MMNFLIPNLKRKRANILEFDAPEVILFAAFLVERSACTHIIQIGEHENDGLMMFDEYFQILKFADGDVPSVSPAILEQSVILYDASDNLSDKVLTWIKMAMDKSAYALIVTPQLNLDNMRQVFKKHGFQVDFTGYSQKDGQTLSVAIVGNNHQPEIVPAPPEFRVVAIMHVYNEGDIILPSLNYLISQGVEVYVLDNWSTDGSFEKAQSLLGKGVIEVERFPQQRPPGSHKYNWKEQLERTEHLARTLDADWFLHHDVDEIRESPWPDVTMRDAIYFADRSGYDVIDHTVIEFFPADDSYQAETGMAEHFQYYKFSNLMGHHMQLRGWKNTGQPVSMSKSGGHEIHSKSIKIFPYKFLLRHYPLRSSIQAGRKIYERKTQTNEHERLQGWHITYDHFDASETAKLFTELCEETLTTCSIFDKQRFYTDFLIKRLSGAGIKQIRAIRLKPKPLRLIEFMWKKVISSL